MASDFTAESFLLATPGMNGAQGCVGVPSQSSFWALGACDQASPPGGSGGPGLLEGY